jgi:hypothetical protein
MALPVKPLATRDVTIAGTTVTIRSLSRAEVIKLGELEGDQEAAELLMLVSGTACTEEEARTFRAETDAPTAEILLEEIATLSGIRDVTPLRCPNCKHEASPDQFVIRDDKGDPKGRASRRSSSGRS